MWIDTPLLVMAAVKKAESNGHDALSAVEGSLARTANMLRCLGSGTLHWVFDGRTRPEKVHTVQQRQEASAKFSQSCVRKAVERDVEAACTVDDDLELAEAVVALHFQRSAQPSLGDVFGRAKQLASEMGTVHIARHDSEEFIARKMNPGDLAVSSDSDSLPFGCTFVVQHFGSPQETWIVLTDVLDALGMTLHDFQQFCVLLGTDFNTRLFRCGPAKALSSIRTPGFSLEEFARKNSADAEWLASAQQALAVFQSTGQSTKEDSGTACL
jgi:5'-3' exonuclease